MWNEILFENLACELITLQRITFLSCSQHSKLDNSIPSFVAEILKHYQNYVSQRTATAEALTVASDVRDTLKISPVSYKTISWKDQKAIKTDTSSSTAVPMLGSLQYL